MGDLRCRLRTSNGSRRPSDRFLRNWDIRVRIRNQVRKHQVKPRGFGVCFRPIFVLTRSALPYPRNQREPGSQRMNPFVFIVGCARSGTTLLQRIVDSHPQIAITPEMHWITDYFRERKWLAPEGRVTAAQVASMV